MLHSMTAIATQQGSTEAASWTWELRSVNGRGLDVKLRLPEGFSTLEPQARARLSAVLSRGNITAGLRLTREGAETALTLDPDRLDAVLEALDQVQERAFDKGVTLGQPTAADVLAQRGVLTMTSPPEDTSPLHAPILADLDAAVAALCHMRASEGAAIAGLLHQQIDQLAELINAARAAAQARSAAMPAQIKAALNRVAIDTVDPDRLHQEIALIAVKSDITEEIDRLDTHITAARTLLAEGGPVGRRLDFLTQEFNREANTLCSKAQDQALTQIGLDLKAVIDQMREQVQNLE